MTIADVPKHETLECGCIIAHYHFGGDICIKHCDIHYAEIYKKLREMQTKYLNGEYSE